MSEKTLKRLEFVVNAAFFAIAAVLIYLSLRYVLGWILPFILALCLVSMVHPLIRRIKRRLGAEGSSVSLVIMLLIYILVCALLVGLVILLVYAFQSMFTSLQDTGVESLYGFLNDLNTSLSTFVHNLPDNLRTVVLGFQEEIINQAQGLLINFTQQGIALLSRFTAKIPSFLIALVFTVMLSFFISIQYDSVVDVIKKLLPKRARHLVGDLKGVTLETIGKYLRATFTLMVITATELSVGLFLLKVQYFIPIALGIALFDALPFFGTGAIVVPWALLELIKGNYPFAIGLGILYGIITVVRNIIEPKIVSDKLGLNPIVSLCAIYLGFSTFGVLGMIFMPIIVQIFLALHQSGSISFLNGILPTGPHDPAKEAFKESEDSPGDS